MRTDLETDELPDEGLEYDDVRYAVDLDEDYNATGFLRVVSPAKIAATVGYVTGHGLMAKFQLSEDNPRAVMRGATVSLIVEVELHKTTRKLRARVYVSGETPADVWTELASW